MTIADAILEQGEAICQRLLCATGRWGDEVCGVPHCSCVRWLEVNKTSTTKNPFPCYKCDHFLLHQSSIPSAIQRTLPLLFTIFPLPSYNVGDMLTKYNIFCNFPALNYSYPSFKRLHKLSLAITSLQLMVTYFMFFVALNWRRFRNLGLFHRFSKSVLKMCQMCGLIRWQQHNRHLNL